MDYLIRERELFIYQLLHSASVTYHNDKLNDGSKENNTSGDGKFGKYSTTDVRKR